MDVIEAQQIAKEYATDGKYELVKLGRNEIAQAVAALANQDEAFAVVINQDTPIQKSLVVCILPQAQRKPNKEDVGNAMKIILGLKIATSATITINPPTEEPTV